jgi:arabinoxylan arabinofuranohydrolase
VNPQVPGHIPLAEVILRGLRRASLLATLTAILSGPAATAQEQILPDFQADPSARVWDDVLWIYPSHDIAGSTGWDMADWHAFSTTDLKHWVDHGVIFGLRDLTWAKKWAWAPDCMRRNGKYYFYFPADDQIGVAVSDRPDGPFHDPLGRPLIARGEGGTRVMDPCIFLDDEGQAYLYFGQTTLCVVKLAEDMVTREGPIVVIDAKKYHEGIWVHKRRGLYYLSYPSFGNGRASRMEYCIGRSPLGPFEYKGTIIDNQSRNIHGSITEFRGQWYLFYHVQGPSPYERRVCMEKLEYNDDGTIRPLVFHWPAPFRP